MGCASHAGPRQQRVEWADDSTLITTGFDAQAKRQFGVWDLRNFEQPLGMGPLNDFSGVAYFHFDREYQMFILNGRGDNTFSVYNFNKSSERFLDHLTDHLYTNATKAFAFGPKYCVDMSKQEVLRGFRSNN